MQIYKPIKKRTCLLFGPPQIWQFKHAVLVRTLIARPSVHLIVDAIDHEKTQYQEDHHR